MIRMCFQTGYPCTHLTVSNRLLVYDRKPRNKSSSLSWLMSGPAWQATDLRSAPQPRNGPGKPSSCYTIKRSRGLRRGNDWQAEGREGRSEEVYSAKVSGQRNISAVGRFRSKQTAEREAAKAWVRDPVIPHLWSSCAFYKVACHEATNLLARAGAQLCSSVTQLTPDEEI